MLGRGLLVVALGFSAYAGVAAVLAQGRRDGRWVVVRPEVLHSARRALLAVLAAVGGASLLLWWALFTRDFSIRYVADAVSRATQPWYTFSSLWSGMEGSLLLWCLVLAVTVAVFAVPRRESTEPFVPWAIPVLAAGLAFFLAMTAGPENPFARAEVVPADGRGLNPLLQSPGMVIHPPMLYAGLIGLLVPFAVAVSALIGRRTGADWIRVVRRWTLAPWLLLGAGLVLGGAWAYTELGWGGYWGWDPVENAALLPWLAATAFLHSAVVQERQGMLKVWNVFLVTLSADLAIFGTFLTRSGLLSSVHAFAESPIGKWFFVFLAAQTLLGLGLIAWRWPELRTRTRFDAATSREAGFLVNNFVFLGAVAVVLWGTLLPLASEALLGRQIAVGPPFFNRVFSPIGALLLILAAVAPALPWRRGRPRRIAARLAVPAGVATVVALAALAITRRGSFSGLLWLAALVGTVSLAEILRAARARARTAGLRPGAALGGVFTRNPRRYGGYLVHLGIALMVLGFAGSLFRTQDRVVASPGEAFDFAGHTIAYRDFQGFRTPDKLVNMAVLDISRDGERLARLRPQLNLHRAWDQPQSEIAIRTTPAADLYVILAGPGEDGEEAVFRLHHNPLVFWVWLGAVVSVAGGLVALFAGSRRGPPRTADPSARREEVPASTP